MVRNTEDQDLIGDLKTKLTIKGHVLGSISLEVARFARSIEFVAVCVHQSTTDPLTLRLR